VGEEKKIKVLIGGRTGYSRLVMRDILTADNDIEVVDTASDGEELFDKAQQYEPDVIVVDIDLPRNARFLHLKRILQNQPVALIFSGTHDRLRGQNALQSIQRTAYDLLIQPGRRTELRSVAEELVSKVRKMADIKIPNAWLETEERHAQAEKSLTQPSHIIAIGASTGGAQAVEYILRELPADFSGAVLVAQHMPSGFTSTFTKRLSSVCTLPVEEGTPGMRVERGQVIVAPGDVHMTVAPHMGSRHNLCIEYYKGNFPGHDMPSADLLMRSAADVYRDKAVGILLSGLGKDGVEGMRHIRAAGGTTIAQDERTSAVFGMPKAAIEEGHVSDVLPLSDIARRIMLETKLTR
jgi:two-component system chemotaxis response regulator CheB